MVRGTQDIPASHAILQGSVTAPNYRNLSVTTPLLAWFLRFRLLYVPVSLCVLLLLCHFYDLSFRSRRCECDQGWKDNGKLKVDSVKVQVAK